MFRNEIIDCVPKHNKYSPTFWAERVLNRHLDVFKGDVCSARRSRVARLDRLSLNAFTTLDQDDSKAIL
jgi:hypothetical protein